MAENDPIDSIWAAGSMRFSDGTSTISSANHGMTLRTQSKVLISHMTSALPTLLYSTNLPTCLQFNHYPFQSKSISKLPPSCLLLFNTLPLPSSFHKPYYYYYYYS